MHRIGVDMPRFQHALSDETARRLKERAAQCRLSVVEMFDCMVDELLNQSTTPFDEIVRRVPSKNRELYQRLAE